jgi:hypothetical protein
MIQLSKSCGNFQEKEEHIRTGPHRQHLSQIALTGQSIRGDDGQKDGEIVIFTPLR